jgi:RNA polymerase sigma-70 factor (ECF subfamily)
VDGIQHYQYAKEIRVLSSDQDFEEIVIGNQRWLLSYVESLVHNSHLAEDIVQETFIRAFKAYNGYEERGLLRRWLRTIARNLTMNYLKTGISLHGEVFGTEPELVGMGRPLTDGMAMGVSSSCEDQVLQTESLRCLLNAMRELPRPQRMVVYYRYCEGYSVDDVAELTRQPKGSVKSKSHYGLRRLRTSLRQYFQKEDYVMECKDTFAYLYQFAQEKIMSHSREKVEHHLSMCERCCAIVDALRVLAPHIGPASSDEMRHYLIDIPLAEGNSLSYAGIFAPMDRYETYNETLNSRGGMIPEDETWFGSGHGVDMEHLAEFDNDGNQIDFIEYPNPNDPSNIRVKYRKMVKVFPMHQMSSVYLMKGSVFSSRLEAPNLMVGKLQNSLGNDAKSGIYLAIPGSALNVRVKKGNGVIDAGTYKFAYSDRYVTEDEVLRLECSYLTTM